MCQNLLIYLKKKTKKKNDTGTMKKREYELIIRSSSVKNIKWRTG